MNEMRQVFTQVNKGARLTDDELHRLWGELDADESGTISKDEFQTWYESFLAEGEAADEGISLEIPDGLGAKIKFFIVLPLVLLMCITMPDVRKEKNEKWYVFTFFMAIVWCVPIPICRQRCRWCWS